jgi:hypothetical protein
VPIFVIFLALVFCSEVVSFSRSMNDMRRAQHARVTSAALTTALDSAAADIETALKTTAQGQGGNITGLPADSTTPFSLCPVIDAANSAASDCAYTVQRRIHWAGLANVGGATNETIANVNTQAVAGAVAVQRDVAVEVDLTLLASNGTTQDGHRVATGHFTVVASCATASQCVAGSAVMNTSVSFNGWKDTAGSHAAAGEALVNGKCATGTAGCSTVGLDNGGVSGVAPMDSRIATQTLCFDPQYAGNGGPNPGDRCHPTGNTPPGPHNSSTYGNQGLANGAATSGALSK